MIPGRNRQQSILSMESKNSLCKTRHVTNIVTIGNLFIGGNHAIMVQSMTNTDTCNVQDTLTQIRLAALAGAELMRIGIPDSNALAALTEILPHSPIPLAADIHFDHKLAIGAIDAGIQKIRINPGNIGSKSKISEVVHAAKSNGIPIRVGVNAGSLEKHLLKKYGTPTAAALAESALINADHILKENYDNLVLSLKASSVQMCVNAYRIVAAKCSFPLHIGITEAGTLLTGAVRSTAGITLLLAEGIGDTVRVSLAADPVEEIHVAYRILESLGLRQRGPVVIACPTCSRTKIDVIGMAQEIENILKFESTPLTVAVMGCAVNGPGEAKEADIGIAGGTGEAVLFKKGNIIGKIPQHEIVKAIVELFHETANEFNSNE